MSNLQLVQGDLQFAGTPDVDEQFCSFKSTGDYDFFSPPVMPESLVPAHNSWPTFESVSFYTVTPSPAAHSPESHPPLTFDPTPSSDITLRSESQTAAPASTSSSTLRVPSNSTRSRSPNHIPRPRNAFMIFRSEFWAEEKITRTVERDHRHISRIIGHCWNQMPEAEKSVWRLKAEQEKLEHGKKHPGYRFAPGSRAQKPVKRNVKRNGSQELLRCRQVAELLLAGKQGGELETAVKGMDPVISDNYDSKKREHKDKGKGKASIPHLAPASASVTGPVKPTPFPGLGREPAKGIDSDITEIPAFRSPLLPPSDSQQGNPSSQYLPGVSVTGNSFPDFSASTYQHYEPEQSTLTQVDSPFQFRPDQYIGSQLPSSSEPPLYIPSQPYTPSQQPSSYAPSCLNLNPQYNTNANIDTDTQVAQYLMNPYYMPVSSVDTNNTNTLPLSSPSPLTSSLSNSFPNAVQYDFGFYNPDVIPQILFSASPSSTSGAI